MKKSYLLIIVVLFESQILIADGVQPEGTGLVGDFYQIQTLENLLWVSTNIESWDKYFIQTADIDASDTQNWNDGAGFDPIGYYDNPNNHPFTGFYNGQNHTITGLYIYRPTEMTIGLFGKIDNALIRNLKIENCEIIGYLDVGGFVGQNYGEIINCSSTGIVSTEYKAVGGFVGENIGEIIDCFSNCIVFGIDNDAGGFAGKNWGELTNCYSVGDVSCEDGSVGGFVGHNSGEIINCYSTGNVNSEDNHVGGFVGIHGYEAEIYNCYSTGNVLGALTVGGFAGNTNEAIISNCYSSGYVNGDNFLGGFIGFNDDSSIYNSFWDTETSNQTISDGGTGKTTQEMLDIATYTNLQTIGLEEPWDFVGNPFDDIGNDDLWDIDTGINNGYPFLTVFPTVGIEEEILHEKVSLHKLKNNYPNPFNPYTIIDFSIHYDSKIELSIYNIRGQRIKTLAQNGYAKGNHSVIWDGVDESGKSVSSGVYYYKLQVNGKNESVKKCLLLK